MTAPAQSSLFPRTARGLSGLGVRLAVPLLFFASGFTGLVYQVLWLKELGLLFGNTSHAAATTLSVFFLGLAAGGYFWGRRAPRLPNGLRTYAWLEAGVAAAALLYFGLMDVYHWLYAPLYAALSERFALLLAAKFLLAALVLFPPSFLMGGTLPVMGQFLIRGAGQLGRTGSFLYGVNTFGACAGAFAAGFYLPAALGFTRSYLLAIAVNLAIAAAAYILSAGLPDAPGGPEAARKTAPKTAKRRRSEPAGSVAASRPGILLLAFFSGFLTLGLEVLWTRMFSQVLQNSVYTFATILVVFLAVLAGGAVIANRLCRLRAQPEGVLSVLLTCSGVAVAATPFLFFDLTDGLRYLGAGKAWFPYIVSVFSGAAVVLLVPGLLIGTVFPYLLRAREGMEAHAGPVIGRLVSLNTLGAVAGSLIAGFALPPAVGLWNSIRLFAAAYLLLALAGGAGRSRYASLMRAAPAAAILLLLTGLDTSKLPVLRLSSGEPERILDIREGHHGVVAVVERESGLRIKVNNYYRLGGTASTQREQNQAMIPLMSHPRPRRVFFLGMGTGITAGAALSHPVERVVVTELVPEVIQAAEKYFNRFANGLFTDPRAGVLAADGRNYLMGTSERFDAIISDLFIPWKAGAGALYTREHYEASLERLRPGGVFVQWIPLYQVSEAEFFTIARTMLDVFPQVVMWRGDFYPERPILALAGSRDAPPLDPRVIVERARFISGNLQLPAKAALAMTLPFYAGNLTEAQAAVSPGPLNTDDWPVIEYRAPVTHRNERSGAEQWFRSLRLASFYEKVWQQTPPEEDPYLRRLDGEQIGYIRAGLDYYQWAVLERLGRREEALSHRREFEKRIPETFEPATEPAGDEAAFVD